MEKKKRRLCDRYDGRRISSRDPLFDVIPNIMPNRTGAMVHYDETIDLAPIDDYVHKKRSEDIPDLRFLHLFVAAIVRVISQKPKTNRFVAGRKVYARNYIRIPMTVKHSLSEDANEEIIMPEFEPTDTLYDVVEKMNKEMDTAFNNIDDNSTAAVAKILHFCPTFIIRFIVFLAQHLDNIGWMPKFIHKASPFHGSVFVVDLGSLGISPVYHHLYDFGTCSAFMTFGKKTKTTYVENGEVKEKKTIGVRVVIDERICDGFYYSSSLRLFKRYLLHPERLEVPPEKVIEDNEA